MSDRDTRRLLVDLSVVSVSAVVVAGGWLAVARVEREGRRGESAPPAVAETSAGATGDTTSREQTVREPRPPREGSSPSMEPASTDPAPTESVQETPVPPARRRRQRVRPAPPVRGVVPAPQPRRRRIIIRRTRAS